MPMIGAPGASGAAAARGLRPWAAALVWVLLGALAGALFSGSRGSGRSAARAASRPPAPAAVAGSSRGGPRIEMRNVDLLAAPDVVLRVHSLVGELEALGRDGIPVFDDPQSFRIV